jgi:hypothetical protein
MDANLVPPDLNHVAVNQTAATHRFFVDGDSLLTQQVDDPQTGGGLQETGVESGNARIGEPEFATAGRSDQRQYPAYRPCD